MSGAEKLLLSDYCRWNVSCYKHFILYPALKAERGNKKYNYTISWTSALDGCDIKVKASAALTSGMNRYPLFRSLGRAQRQSGHITLLYDMNVRHETSWVIYRVEIAFIWNWSSIKHNNLRHWDSKTLNVLWRLNRFMHAVITSKFLIFDTLSIR